MDEPGIIKKLEEVVVNRIAAGEVIQRPANALKELIENSLDAKSSNIQIVVKAGGLKYLQIQDNGTGIRRDNMEIVCERFTTSKLSKYEDLGSIQTYGFRGEALASISHVAHLTIMTKTSCEKCAFKASYEDGILKGQVKPCAGNQGTQITVEDLFYNVSTRKKALKSPSEEYQKIFEVVGCYAVHNAKVGFVLKKFGENTDLRTPTKSNFVDNIRIVYGNNIARELMEITHKDEVLKLNLHGYITNVNYSTKKGIMLLFINHRLVESTAIKKAVDTVYSTYLPKNGHSFLYLSLELDPQNVDVNVHPTKHEVHFLHEEQIIEKIKLIVEAKLLSCNTSRVLYTQTRLPGATNPDVTQFEDKPNKPGDKQINPKFLVRTDAAEQKIDKFFGYQVSIMEQEETDTNLNKEDMENETMEVDLNLNLESSNEKEQNVNELEPNVNGMEQNVNENGKIVYAKEENASEEKLLKNKPKSPQKNHKPGVIMASTPAHLTYVNPKDSFKTRKFSEHRNETRLTSVKMLRMEVEERCNAGLREILANLVFIGLVDETRALIQHSTKMYLCNSIKLMEELFYEILLYDFQNFGFMKFANPLPVRELAMLALDLPASGWSSEDGEKSEIAAQVRDLLISKGAMLLEYFSLEIDTQGKLLSLPLLLENYTPFMGALPMFILQLATEVNWDSEKECFQAICRQTAIFFSQQSASKEEAVVKANHWTQEHVVFAAIRKYFLPPKQFAENGAILQIASLPDLYKVFERC